MEFAKDEYVSAKDGSASRRRPAPAVGSPPGLLDLQMAVGNAAVVEMLRRAGHPRAHTGARGRHHSGAGGHQAGAPEVQRSTVDEVLRRPGRPLDGVLRSEMESRLGADFSDVRLHSGSAAKQSAAELGARAYTSGHHVVIGDGAGDKHTLAHELTHVIQQRYGPVAGTDNGAGLRVSDPSDRFEREAEANARAVMGRPTLSPSSDVQRATGAHAHNPAPPVQRAEASEAAKPDKQAEYIRKNVSDLRGWAADRDDADQYDLMIERGDTWQPLRKEQKRMAFRSRETSAVPGGRAFIAGQSRAHRTAVDEELAEDQGREKDRGWREPVRQKIEVALKRKMLHHYTTRDRVEAVLDHGDSGELKSIRRLNDEDPDAKHNTSKEDVADLANHGFVFFFIEKENAPFKDSRFSKGGDGPARIGVPFDRLLKNGWIMLNDFIEMEYPVLRSDADGNLLSYRTEIPDRTASPEAKMRAARRGIKKFWEENRKDDDRINELARALSESFAGGAQSIGPEEVAKIKDLTLESSKVNGNVEYRRQVDKIGSEFAKSVRFGSQVRRYDPGNRALPRAELRYMKGGTQSFAEATANDEIERYREQLHGNILAGAHIIPGLAARGILEISRIEAQGGNQAVVERLTSMSGDDLVDTLLKDFFRPQAMLPWSVAITRGDVQYP